MVWCRDWQEGTSRGEEALTLYEAGQPSDVFTLVLQGKAFIRAGEQLWLLSDSCAPA